MASSVPQRIKDKFGDLYNYDKLNYQGANVKVVITCLSHGDFEVWPYNYLSGKGCPKCSTERTHDAVRLTTEDFISKARAKHGDRYDYSKSVYTGKQKKLIVICREHGEFTPIASNHYINGTGCPKCGLIKAHEKFKKSTEQLVEDNKAVHGKRYSYDRTERQANKEPIALACPTHGEPPGMELDLFEYVKSLVGDSAVNKHTTSGGVEIDVAVPSKNIGFEFNGLYGQSEAMGKGPLYHVSKTEKCAEEGIRLIHIFEDEWVLSQEKVKSKICHLLGLNNRRIYARNTEVKEISAETAIRFFKEHHIQGAGQAGTFNIGLVTKEGVLVAAMNFCHDRYSKVGDREKTMELLRFASSRHVVGGASKLLSYFLKHKPETITRLVSYSDRRWGEGNLYKQLGFDLVWTSFPSYFYVDPSKGVRMNRQRFQKHLLSKKLRLFDPKKTEVQNCLDNGLFRIFDCGTHKWEMAI